MSYIYPGRSLNMENNLKAELGRRRRAAWAAFRPLREAIDQLTENKLRAHLFDSTVLLSLCYAAETWSDTAATLKSLSTVHRALERCLLRYSGRTQLQAGLRSSHLRRTPAFTIRRNTYRKLSTDGPVILCEGKRDRCFRCTDRPAERSAGNESKFSPASSTMLLYDNGGRKNRMEAMPVRHVNHVSI
ncbi:hypothetical protein Y032_0180g768 [Ancylostoma ceylanicum]|uniref:Uncharacterized protein n=1 Tax=Ancylostoma ceylanicum TaxID=53326 RepID=A0A016STE4_9BILA|nr:hypothetical protein Y032_0180g768 [Ancylostoma ceylanicum]